MLDMIWLRTNTLEKKWGNIHVHTIWWRLFQLFTTFDRDGYPRFSSSCTTPRSCFDGLSMVAYPLCGSAAVWTCKYYVLLLFVLCLFGLIHAWLLSYGYVPLVWSCLPQFGWVYLYQSGEERSSFSFRGARVVKILPFMLHIAIFISLNILDARLPIIQLD